MAHIFEYDVFARADSEYVARVFFALYERARVYLLSRVSVARNIFSFKHSLVDTFIAQSLGGRTRKAGFQRSGSARNGVFQFVLDRAYAYAAYYGQAAFGMESFRARKGQGKFRAEFYIRYNINVYRGGLRQEHIFLYYKRGVCFRLFCRSFDGQILSAKKIRFARA